MMQVGAYDPMGAMIVFRDLDPYDLLEAQALRGRSAPYAELFANWHAAQAGAPISAVLKWSGTPFAVLVVGNTGQAGVAQAALLARPHKRWRGGLIAAARTIRVGMPGLCGELGIHRVEARTWSQHPHAGRFLRLCGLQHETAMSGFGAAGTEIFHQYAWQAKPR